MPKHAVHIRKTDVDRINSLDDPVERFRYRVPGVYRTPGDFNKVIAALQQEWGVESAAELIQYPRIDQLDIDRLFEWCGHVTSRWVILETLLDMLNYRHLTKFQVRMDQIIAREKFVRKFNKQLKVKVNGSLSLLRELYNRYPRFERLDSATAQELWEWIRETAKLVHLSNARSVELIGSIIQSQEVAVRLRELYEANLKSNIITKFIDLHPWYSVVIDKISEHHRRRLAHTSSAVDETLKTHLQHSVQVLSLFHSYIMSKIENGSPEDFYADADRDELIGMIIWAESKTTPRENVKSQRTRHSASRFVTQALSVLNILPVREASEFRQHVRTLTKKNILSGIQDRRVKPSVDLRRHFFEWEIDKIRGEATGDPEFLLMIRFLQEIAPRITALCNLRIGTVIDSTGQVVKNTSILGKGNKLRTIILSEGLKEDLDAFIHTLGWRGHPERFLFQRPGTDGREPMRTGVFRRKFKRIANSAGITGAHVHPHAFRHTLVNRLMAEGNDITSVSRYIGHDSTETTEIYYWTTMVTDMIDRMNIPWLTTTPASTSQTAATATTPSTDLSVVFYNAMTEEQRNSLRTRIPDLDKTMQDLYKQSTFHTRLSSEALSDSSSDDSCSDEPEYMTTYRDFI